MKNGYLLLLLLLSLLVQAQVVVKKIEPSPNAQSTGSTLQNNSKLRSMSFGLTTTLMLLYGLDDLALIESTCLHYPKNQKLSFSLFSNYGGNTIQQNQMNLL
jgi:hypothetical protein